MAAHSKTTTTADNAPSAVTSGYSLCPAGQTYSHPTLTFTYKTSTAGAATYSFIPWLWFAGLGASGEWKPGRLTTLGNAAAVAADATGATGGIGDLVVPSGASRVDVQGKASTGAPADCVVGILA
jgi:hypothetical protein